MENRMTRAHARSLAVAVAVLASVALPATAFARFGDRTLRTGSQGHDVRVLQSWLDKMGFETGIDGAFGRGTRWSLRRFEQARGLRINGVLTRSDAQAMRRAMSSRFRYEADDAEGVSKRTTTTQTAPGSKARMSSDGLHAIAPADAPQEVRDAIAAANKIVGKPYKYGGGHGSWNDSGYDCSGTVSYALHGAGLLDRPMSSGEFGSWGIRGKGQWISVYYNSGHVYAIIAGLRLDTSGSGGKGPRWHTDLRSGDGYGVTHWRGL
jgi:peptidoglycan hydrolase-like protein with peptidoglycan-binding domain